MTAVAPLRIEEMAIETGAQYALGARIMRLRKELLITQAGLARSAGMLRSNLARIEAGRHMVTLNVVMRIAKALEVRPSEILSVLDEVRS